MSRNILGLGARSLVHPNELQRVAGVTVRSLLKVQNKDTVTGLVARSTIKHNPLSTNTSPVVMYGLSLRSLLPYTPNFEWIEMFTDAVFPNDISYNSVGTIRFNTDITMVASGFDQRNALWDQPLMEYNVAYGVRTMEQLHALIAFFRKVRGSKTSFRFTDHLDYTSSYAMLEEAREPEPITPEDQVIGTGDDYTETFQLVKAYRIDPDDTDPTLRPIIKPVDGTVVVALDGVQKTNFTADPSTGIVTFTSSKSTFGINWMLTQVAGQTYKINKPTGLGQTFVGFANGDTVKLSGFVSLKNKVGPANLNYATVSSVTNADEMLIIFPPLYGMDEGPVAGVVTVSTKCAPSNGALVTAGFEFHVPVRFDTDRLPITLENYGIGSATEVKLIEVRPYGSDT